MVGDRDAAVCRAVPSTSAVRTWSPRASLPNTSPSPSSASSSNASASRGGVTFREVAQDYLRWLEEVKGAKPATLRDRESVLAEPGAPYRRGDGTINGHVIAALGDRSASKVTTREINELLASISATGVSSSTVNKYRAVIVSIFNYGARADTFGLRANPAVATDKRREPDRVPLVYYSPEEIEALARALSDGVHRESTQRGRAARGRRPLHPGGRAGEDRRRDPRVVGATSQLMPCVYRSSCTPSTGSARPVLRRHCERVADPIEGCRSGRAGGAGADDLITTASSGVSERQPTRGRDDRGSSEAGTWWAWSGATPITRQRQRLALAAQTAACLAERAPLTDCR
jgi:hypothetical protein